jgi:chromosome segregation ATPase
MQTTWCRPAEMARRLSVTERTIYNMMKRGDLERRELHGRVWVRYALGETAPLVLSEGLSPFSFDDSEVAMDAMKHSESLPEQDLESLRKGAGKLPEAWAGLKSSPEGVSAGNSSTSLASMLDRIEYLHDELRRMAIARERAVGEVERVKVRAEYLTEENEGLKADLSALQREMRLLRAELGHEREASNVLSQAARMGWRERKTKKRFLEQAAKLRRSLPAPE